MIIIILEYKGIELVLFVVWFKLDINIASHQSWTKICSKLMNMTTLIPLPTNLLRKPSTMKTKNTPVPYPQTIVARFKGRELRGSFAGFQLIPLKSVGKRKLHSRRWRQWVQRLRRRLDDQTYSWRRRKNPNPTPIKKRNYGSTQ